MKNFVQDGVVLTLTSPTGGILAGQGFVVGNIFAIAAYDAIEGAEVEVVTRGVFILPKAAGIIAEGAKVWWNDTLKVVVNATGAGFFPIGVAVAGAGDTDTTVRVKLDGIAVVAAAA
ncbi:MAG TPA: DUF2190 family protein [Methyloceanibacter sp.]|jgi:predicted RecA/RadA family phage recombinase|nr:DUF2190 family protein [Methyloceanibacter sp.]